jgi:hypothetical protein
MYPSHGLLLMDLGLPSTMQHHDSCICSLLYFLMYHWKEKIAEKLFDVANIWAGKSERLEQISFHIAH